MKRYLACSPVPVVLLACFLMASSASVAVAQDIYVDPVRGSDANPGTTRRPVKSVSAAVAKLPEIVTTLVRVHLAPGVYRTTGGRDMPANNLILDRRMRRKSDALFDVSVHIVGEGRGFNGRARRGQVVLDWPASSLVRVESGVWHIENVQIGNRSYPNSQQGVEVYGTGSLLHLRDVRIRTGTLSGAGILAVRGGEVRLYGRIELNEDLHEKAPPRSFCAIYAFYNGVVRCRDPRGSLDMGNGSISVGYYGVVELGCKTARITSWGGQSNCLAINDSGRIDLHGTETTLCAKMKTNAVIGLEDDGHILAEGARIVLKTQPGAPASVVLQKYSALYGGPLVVEGPNGLHLWTMSGSNFVGAAVGKVDTVCADTGSYIYLSYKGKPGKVQERRNGKVDIE